MKKFTLLFLLALTGGVANAQLTLTDINNAPVSGDKYSMYHCDSVNTVPGPRGTGQVWSYTAMTTYSNLVSNYTVSAASTTAFPGASVSIASSSSDASYMTGSISDLKYYGGNLNIGSLKASVVYTTPAIVAKYPMTYNDSATAVVGGSINITSPIAGSGTFSGNCKTVADGTGTLVLPGSTGLFANVLRVVSSQTLNFNVSVFGAPISGSAYQTVYSFFYAGTKNPIFSITTTSFSAAGNNGSQNTVLRDKNAVGSSSTPTTATGIADNRNQASVAFPNPASTVINFQNVSPAASAVLMYDITGKLVSRSEVVDGKSSVDVASMNKGLYLYNVVTTSGAVIASGKVTVIH